jgi:hypothetical protein
MGLIGIKFKKKEPNIFEQIADLLHGKGIKFRNQTGEGQIFNFEANVGERIIGCTLNCDIKRKLLTFSAILLNPIPSNKIAECLELMARFNEKIWYGGFEFSFEHNLVSLVTTLPIDNALISYEQLERLCFNNLLNVHFFQDGFESLIVNNFKVEDIYNKIINIYQKSGQ